MDYLFYANSCDRYMDKYYLKVNENLKKGSRVEKHMGLFKQTWCWCQRSICENEQKPI